MNWLRRLFGKLDRRWIHDPKEREEHDELVRERLRKKPDDDEGVVGARVSEFTT